MPHELIRINKIQSTLRYSAGGMAQAVEHLPSKCKAPSLNTSTTKTTLHTVCQNSKASRINNTNLKNYKRGK
jgi:hypothetical protein